MRTRSLKIDNIGARQVILMMEVAMTGGNDGNTPWKCDKKLFYFELQPTEENK